eukprot:m.143571 g.143571  ORF g.143571 m.143571 type:complete len:112 (-) comp14900_c2_seq5:483-818(-)
MWKATSICLCFRYRAADVETRDAGLEANWADGIYIHMTPESLDHYLQSPVLVGIVKEYNYFQTEEITPGVKFRVGRPQNSPKCGENDPQTLTKYEAVVELDFCEADTWLVM